MGPDCSWEMRRGRLSGRYTTRLDEVLKVVRGGALSAAMWRAAPLEFQPRVQTKDRVAGVS